MLTWPLQLYEGLKCYYGVDNRLRIFRPEMNMARMKRTAWRAALPVSFVICRNTVELGLFLAFLLGLIQYRKAIYLLLWNTKYCMSQYVTLVNGYKTYGLFCLVSSISGNSIHSFGKASLMIVVNGACIICWACVARDGEDGTTVRLFALFSFHSCLVWLPTAVIWCLHEESDALNFSPSNAIILIFTLLLPFAGFEYSPCH